LLHPAAGEVTDSPTFQELVHSHSIAALYGKITTMKLPLIVGGCICALASLWGAVAICGMWFIVPRDHSMTAAHDILIRFAYTALFVVASKTGDENR
jgi:hypothetical protein